MFTQANYVDTKPFAQKFVGKDSGHWSALFDKVQNYSLRKQLEIAQAS